MRSGSWTRGPQREGSHEQAVLASTQGSETACRSDEACDGLPRRSRPFRPVPCTRGATHPPTAVWLGTLLPVSPHRVHRRRLFHFAVVLATASVSAACGDRAGPRVEVEETDGVLERTLPASSLDLRAPFVLAQDPDLRLGTSTGAEEERFGRVVGARVLPDGSVVLLDAGLRDLLRFDRSGALLWRVARTLEVEREAEEDTETRFRLPQHLALLGRDTLAVWDPGLGDIVLFDLEGEEIGVEPLELGSEVERVVALHPGFDGGMTVVSVASTEVDADFEGWVRQRGLLHRWTSGGEIGGVSEVAGPGYSLRRRGEGSATRIRDWYHPDLLTAGGANGVWVTDGTDWRVELWSPGEDRPRERVRIDAPRMALDRETLEALHLGEIEQAGDDPERIGRLRVRQGEREYPSHRPPLIQLQLDAADRLWMGLVQALPEALPSGGGPAVRDWLILDEGREPLGRVTLPSGSGWLWADEGSVLLVRYDELGLPFVERYPLEGR